MTPNIGSAISYCRLGILGDLTDGLKEIGIAKKKRKELYNAATQKTRRIKIREKTEVEKKRLDIKRELGARQLALEEKQQAFREKMALEARRYRLYTRLLDNPYPRSASINWTLVMEEHNPFLEVGDEFFTSFSPNKEDFLVGTYHN